MPLAGVLMLHTRFCTGVLDTNMRACFRPARMIADIVFPHNTHLYASTYKHVRTLIHSHTYTLVHAHTFSVVHTRVPTYTHMHTRTYTYIHMR